MCRRELNPCPSCGAECTDGPSEGLTINDDDSCAVFVDCAGCGVQGPNAGGVTSAIDAWDAMTAPAPCPTCAELRARIAAVREWINGAACQRRVRRAGAWSALNEIRALLEDKS
jgi:hypothetical protein